MQRIAKTNSQCLTLVCDQLLAPGNENLCNNNDSDVITLNETPPVENDLERITAVITDCAPDFILKELEKLAHEPKRIEMIIYKLVENKSYPKLKDYLNRENKKKEVDKLINMKVSNFFLLQNELQCFLKNYSRKSSIHDPPDY